jgi:hypothetical protein
MCALKTTGPDTSASLRARLGHWEDSMLPERWRSVNSWYLLSVTGVPPSKEEGILWYMRVCDTVLTVLFVCGYTCSQEKEEK